MSDRCPLCGKLLSKWDYSYDYMSPPEYGEKCINKKCIGYEKSFMYYYGYKFKVGKWEYKEADDNLSHKNLRFIGEHFESASNEFNLRIKYYKKRRK